MFGRRGCMFSLGGLVGLILICCLLGNFVALPRFQDTVSKGFGNAIDDTVATRLQPSADGTITIPLSDLSAAVENDTSGDSTQIEGIKIRGEGDRIVVDFGTSGQEWQYSGRPTVVDGKLDLVDMEGDNGWLDKFLPPSVFEKGIERGVNNALDLKQLTLVDVQVTSDSLVLTVQS